MLSNVLVSNASITSKYTNFLLIDVNRGPYSTQNSRQFWGRWIRLSMLLAYKKRLLPILNGPLPPDRLIVPSSNDNGNISVFKNRIGCADLELALMRKRRTLEF